MPFNVSEEQSLLSSILSERDAQISTLTHQLHSTSEVLQHTQKELQSKSSARKSQREEHSATIKRLKEEHAEQRRVLAKFEQNVKNGGGLRVHEYAALMRSANSNRVESSYVIRLQAQLCRAMHSLGVMESQLALVKENCSSLIKFMKEDLSHMVDDRTRREIELMNGLASVDNEKRVMAKEMEAKMQEKEELLDQVREEYEELGLEYDEGEVKKALEVKYLLEQMDKVREDKVRLEKELLAALLEREEQINRLRGETEDLGTKLYSLKKAAEKKDIRYGEGDLAVSEDTNHNEIAQAETDVDQVDGNGGADVDGQAEAVSGVTSQLDTATKDESQVAEESKPISVSNANQSEEIDSSETDNAVKATLLEVSKAGAPVTSSADSLPVVPSQMANAIMDETTVVGESNPSREDEDYQDKRVESDKTAREVVTTSNAVSKEEESDIASTDDANVAFGTTADSEAVEKQSTSTEKEDFVSEDSKTEASMQGAQVGTVEEVPASMSTDGEDIDAYKAAESEPFEQQTTSNESEKKALSQVVQADTDDEALATGEVVTTSNAVSEEEESDIASTDDANVAFGATADLETAKTQSTSTEKEDFVSDESKIEASMQGAQLGTVEGVPATMSTDGEDIDAYKAAESEPFEQQTTSLSQAVQADTDDEALTTASANIDGREAADSEPVEKQTIPNEEDADIEENETSATLQSAQAERGEEVLVAASTDDAIIDTEMAAEPELVNKTDDHK